VNGALVQDHLREFAPERHGRVGFIALPRDRERAIHTETMALGSGQVIGSQLEKHEFADEGGATVMRITQTYNSKEDRDGALASGMDQGMEACYQQLEALLAQPA
jgi:hypothetical protein